MAIFSDDELVAAAAVGKHGWPGLLPSVRLTEEDLLAAGVRGVHSLTDRNLATVAGAEVTVAPQVAVILDRVAKASNSHVIYVSETSTPESLLGSAIFLHVDDGGGVLDLMTSAGVHDLEEVPTSHGLDVIAAFAGNVHRAGIGADTGSDAAAFVRSTSSPDDAIRITKGTAARGRFVSTDGYSTFDPSELLSGAESEIISYLSAEAKQ